jgi:hypothetical protein
MKEFVLRIPLPDDDRDPAPMIMRTFEIAINWLRRHDLRVDPEMQVHDRAGICVGHGRIEESR